MADRGPRAIDAAVIGDPEISTLAAVFDPETARKYLQRILPTWGPVQEISLRILKRHRTRCTFEIAWRAENRERCVVGKVYATDRTDVYRVMEEIRRAGFGPQEAFSIPEPLAYVPELRLLLQEKVQGPRAKQVFLTGAERDRVEAAERCAQWLVRFQARAPRVGRPYRVDHHLNSVDQSWHVFAALGGPLAEKAATLCEQLKAAARGLRPNDLCAGHGEYTCGQVLLAEGRTVTVDWDIYDVADPCRDLAKFLVDLMRIGWKNPPATPALDRAAGVFLKTYVSLGRLEVRGNLPFHAAVICLRLAKKDIDHREVRWPEKAAAMLDEGLRVLARGLESWCSN